MAKQKKALALISGGFDSPVAAYRMVREGWHLDYWFFYSLPFVKPKDREMVVECIKAIKQKTGQKESSKLFVINNKKIHDKLRESTDAYYHLITRRLMYAVASEIAKKNGYSALVTGDNLAQVSSQTLHNLALLTPSSKVPILRPLLGFEKRETIAISKELGTFDFSKHCKDCALGEVVNPKVNVTEKELKDREKKLGSASMVKIAVAKVEQEII